MHIAYEMKAVALACVFLFSFPYSPSPAAFISGRSLHPYAPLARGRARPATEGHRGVRLPFHSGAGPWALLGLCCLYFIRLGVQLLTQGLHRGLDPLGFRCGTLGHRFGKRGPKGPSREPLGQTRLGRCALAVLGHELRWDTWPSALYGPLNFCSPLYI